MASFVSALAADRVPTYRQSLPPTGTGRPADPTQFVAGMPALATGIGAPRGLAYDSKGRLYVASATLHCVLRLDPDGTLAVVLGKCQSDRTYVDAPHPIEMAAFVTLSAPTAVAVDSQDRVYVAEADAHRIVRPEADGKLTVVAGTRTRGPGQDGGAATNTALDHPVGLAIDAAGNLYVAQDRLHRVRKIEAGSGKVSTLAGTGERGSSGDGGPASQARLSFPTGLALDRSDGLLVTERDSGRVRRIDLRAGTIASVVAPRTGGPAPLVDPVAIAVRGDDMFVADAGRHVLVAIDRYGRQRTLAGTGVRGTSRAEGPATQTALDTPFAIAVEASGGIAIAEMGQGLLRRVSATGRISTLAGNGGLGYLGDGGPARDSVLNVEALAVDAGGHIYFADRSHHRVRRIDRATGVISTAAGTGMAGFSGDGGPGTEARLFFPRDLELDPLGRLLILDEWRVRRLDPRTGRIETVVGGDSPQSGTKADAAPAADVADLASLAGGADRLYLGSSMSVLRVDLPKNRVEVVQRARLSPEGRLRVLRPGGQLLLSDPRTHTIVELDPESGVTKNLAGIGKAGFGGDGGPATQAALNMPLDVAMDSKGNWYIADHANRRIRRVDAKGTIKTIEVASAPRDFAPQVVAVAGDDTLVVGAYDQIFRLTLRDGVLEHIAGVRTTVVWP